MYICIYVKMLYAIYIYIYIYRRASRLCHAASGCKQRGKGTYIYMKLYRERKMCIHVYAIYIRIYIEEHLVLVTQWMIADCTKAEGHICNSCIFVYIYVHVCIYICIYIYIYYIYVYIYIYIYIYIYRRASRLCHAASGCRLRRRGRVYICHLCIFVYTYVQICNICINVYMYMLYIYIYMKGCPRG